MRRSTMYMHTLDGQPASYDDRHGSQYLYFASWGHQSRAAKLVPTLDQIRREQQSALRSELREWREWGQKHGREQPDIRRFGYVLVEVPAVSERSR